MVGFGSADGWVLGASFTVGAAPVWGEFFEFGFPFVEVVVEGCCVRQRLLVTGVSAGFWRARMLVPVLPAV